MTDMSRREALGAIGLIASATAISPSTAFAEGSRPAAAGRLKHSVSRWCYGKIPIDDLCEAAKNI